MEMSKHARIVRGLIISVVALLVGGLCALIGQGLEQDELFEAWGTMIKMLGLIMLAAAGLGLVYSLGRLGVAHDVIPRRLPSLFLVVTVVVLGLLAMAAWVAWLYASEAVDFFDDTIRCEVPLAMLIFMAVSAVIWAAILSTIARAAR